MDISLTVNTIKSNFDDGEWIVVIDPGHGGHDPGAKGKKSSEKDITLNISKKIGDFISGANPEVKIIYTRTKDVFIPLHKRIALANKKKADIFVSIHCNYVNTPSICGTETYVMGLHRAEENLEVAKRENSVVLMEEDYENKYEGYDPNSPVGHILLSMFQNIYLGKSIELADRVEQGLSGRKLTHSRGVKQAGFVVLRKATMPAILVETGFLSNPKEETYLMSDEGQREIAESIGEAIVGFFSGMPPVNAHQSVISDEDDKISPPKYVIQLGVFSQKKSPEFIAYFSNYGTVEYEYIDNKYKYHLGGFTSLDDANAILKSIQKDKVKDAFIRRLR